MEIKTAVQDNVTIITPTGRVDTSTAKAFEDGVMSAVNSSNKIAIRFDEIDYISSAGLRVVLMAGKKLTSLKGILVLINMPEKIFSIFKMSGFDKILKICPSFEESKQFFN
ncbi:MAG: STAS domain-containing protein [Holosporaceae bacterium]|jgi:anti-sigma B factor antagonist/stage II sporulation protein AA (anti-sigma F factor antagonist)|nr:STAS domain-containing protein [Holosporaceae bacterium]